MLGGHWTSPKDSLLYVWLNSHKSIVLYSCCVGCVVIIYLQHETRNSCAGSNEYDLAAVIVHHGTGLVSFFEPYLLQFIPNNVEQQSSSAILCGNHSSETCIVYVGYSGFQRVFYFLINLFVIEAEVKWQVDSFFVNPRWTDFGAIRATGILMLIRKNKWWFIILCCSSNI